MLKELKILLWQVLPKLILLLWFIEGVQRKFRKKYTQLDRLKFQSDRKKMSTIVQRDEGKYFIYMKGAPEVVIGACSHYLRPNGDGINELRPEDIRRLDDATKEYSSLTLRNIAIAMKEISVSEFNNFQSSKMNTNHLNFEKEKSVFTLIGIWAINEHLRSGVPTSLSLCHSAFVKFIMITSDDIRIAGAIAKNIGIINKNKNY